MKYSLLAVLSLLLFVPTASATTYQANTSNYTSVVNAAVAGDVVELASGTYNFTTQHPSGLVTVRPASGATVTGSIAGTTATGNLKLDNFNSFSGAVLDGSTNVTVSHTNFTAPAIVKGHAVNVSFDNDVFNNLPTGGPGGNEGRLGYMNGATGTVSNSVFSNNAGCADGIMISGGGGDAPNVNVIGNEFFGIIQGSCSAHTDPLQFYGGMATIKDNYFHNNSTGIMSSNGNGSPSDIENNVFEGTGEYPWSMVNGGGSGDTIRHNVVTGWGIEFGPGDPGFATNETARDNISTDGIILYAGQPSSGVSQDYNLCGSGSTCTGAHTIFGSATYVGGSGRCKFALAVGSLGKNAASDGTDIGLNDCGGAPVVACNDGADNDSDGLTDYPADPGCTSSTDTDETNVVNNTPVARFSASPEPSAPNQQVTFDATASTCADTPCTYTWTDEPPGGGVWPLGTGSTLNFTFTGLGTKYVNLVVQDADGDTNRVEHHHVVQNAADTTPPDTNITANPTNPTTSTSASFSFTSTETGSTFECKMDAGSYAACTSPKTYSNETQLSLGSHTFSVRATDAANNTDPTPATYTWTINAVASVVAPTFIQERETTWTPTATSKTTTSMTVNAGDVLVTYGLTADQPTSLSVSGGSLTWTEKQQVNVTGYGRTYVWTATVNANKSMTVTCTRTAGVEVYGCNTLVFRGSTGIGATNKANGIGTPSLNLTTVSSNSAVVKAVDDWVAKDGSARNSLTTGVGAFTEQTYQFLTGVYTVYGGYHANVGAAGAKTIGYSVPTGQTYAIVGVEVKGT